MKNEQTEKKRELVFQNRGVSVKSTVFCTTSRLRRWKSSAWWRCRGDKGSLEILQNIGTNTINTRGVVEGGDGKQPTKNITDFQIRFLKNHPVPPPSRCRTARRCAYMAWRLHYCNNNRAKYGYYQGIACQGASFWRIYSENILLVRSSGNGCVSRKLWLDDG